MAADGLASGWRQITCDHHADVVHVRSVSVLNLSPPEQNGRHFADDILRCIFVNGKFCVLIVA